MLDNLLVLIAPVIVWLVTLAVVKVKEFLGTEGFGGTVVVTLIVPGLSMLLAWISQMVLNTDLSFWVVFGLSLVGAFIKDFITQWSETFKGIQESVSTKLSGL